MYKWPIKPYFVIFVGLSTLGNMWFCGCVCQGKSIVLITHRMSHGNGEKSVVMVPGVIFGSA